jgi:hypothetical protein
LFPTFGVSDYESLLVALAAIGVQPYRDDLNKRRMSCGIGCLTNS